MKSLAIKGALALAGAAVLTAGGVALAQQDFVRNTEATTRACFDTEKMEGYAPIDLGESDGINLRVALDGVYQLEFAAPCPSVKEANGVTIATKNGSRFLCTGGEADLVVRGALAGPRTCQVTGVRKLSSTEIAALPRANRP